MTSQQTGQLAEEKSLEHLRRHGLKLVTQNYNCSLGEIDLIMQDGGYLVFIEVRLRSNLTFGSGIESITETKKKKIMRATYHYLKTYKHMDKTPIRFDVISVEGKTGKITWVQDAFGEDY